jgi:AmmeMemoRadiSam system protein B
MFYPAEADPLRAMVEGWVEGATVPADLCPRAIIGPHAGFVFSGAVAGTAYAAVRRAKRRIRRVVCVGPSHHVAFAGAAVPDGDIRHFATPLGEVPLDDAGIAEALRWTGVAEFDEAHRREHAIETHLPFMQAVLGRFTLVPLVFSDIEPDTLAAALDALWDDTTLLAVSSDLSHYHDMTTARRMDRAAADAIECGDPDALSSQQACGCTAIKALLQLTRSRGLRGRTLDLRTSGETAGPTDRVVGYGAFAFD